jgi:hypothetical protein
LDHHNLPVVAGDCLLALPITPRRSAEMHADRNPAFTEAVGMMFSVIVKWEIFTKHILSQWTRIGFFSPSEVIAAVQPLASRRPVKIEEGSGAHLFSRSPFV